MITDYSPLYSYILLTGVAMLVALLDTFRIRRRACCLGLLTALAAVIALALDATAADSAPWKGLMVFGAFSRAFDAVFLVTLAVVAIGSAAEERRMKFAGEYYALLLFSTMGLMLIASSGGLLALYIGVELSTTCLFALVGFAKREQRSAEAALKMLVLGAVASAVFLYGASILYGVARTTQFEGIAGAVGGMQGASAWAFWLGLAFVVGGLGFKIAAVPFHLWAPDVYEGAPTTVTAFLSTASKAGGFAALLRVLLLAFGDASGPWLPLIVSLSALSMILGNLVAIVQSNLKRMLAYSGIAQAGYILVAVAGSHAAGRELGVSSVLMYLFLYAFTNIGGFLVAQAVADATGSDQVIALRGLHRRSPGLAFAMLIVLFSLGGIPPLAGFVGKLYLFAAGWKGEQYALVLVGALTSVIALYYYLMVALQVYIRDPEDDRRMPVARPLGIAIAICVIGTIAIGVYPRPWVEMGERASAALQNPPPVASLVARMPLGGYSFGASNTIRLNDNGMKAR
jgi:NADH-quinone oxidoreductase subunit N